jgi:hypothetical protein
MKDVRATGEAFSPQNFRCCLLSQKRASSKSKHLIYSLSSNHPNIINLDSSVLRIRICDSVLF